MAKPIHLAAEVTFDSHNDGDGRRVLLQAASGGGKSSGMRLMLERMPKSVQQIIIDVEDEFQTLRRAGHDYVILGGPQADAPGLIELDWRELATVVLQTGANFIFQLNDWGLDRQREFIGQFIEGLLSAPQELWRPMVVALDETDLFAGNGVTHDSSAAVFDLAKRGRKRGITTLYATQRMARLSADVRGLVENLIIGKVNQSLDQRAAAEALGFSPRATEVLAMKTFRPGEFWIVGPAFGGGEPQRARLDRPETSAPKAGVMLAPSAAPAALRKALKSLPRRPEPAATKTYPANGMVFGEPILTQPDPAALEAARHEGHTAGRAEGWQECWGEAQTAIQTALARIQAGFPAPSRADPPKPTANGHDPRPAASASTPPLPRPARAAPVAQDGLSAAASLFLQEFAAAYPQPLTFVQAALFAGRSPKSSNQRVIERELIASGLLTEQGHGRWSLVASAAHAMGGRITKRSPADVAAFWIAKLPGAPSKFLQAIWNAKGFDSREEWAEAAGISAKSSNVRAATMELASLRLVVLTDDGGATLAPGLA